MRGGKRSVPILGKLILFALFWAGVLLLWSMPVGHSFGKQKVLVPSEERGPDFAQPLPPVKGAVLDAAAAKDPHHDPFAIVNGVDFFANYDVTKVPQTPQLYEATLEKPIRFNYMDRAASKWPFLWVSAVPRIAYVPDFLTNEECDLLKETAEPQMQRSLVVARGTDKPIDDRRTSSQTWLSVTSGIGKQVADKIYELIGFPPGSSELLQILRYEVGQKYDAHMDYFDPPQRDNRAVTVYLYLSDVEEGGHTWFPDADNATRRYDYSSCRGGFGFKPHKRTAVVFYDMKPNGDYDPWSLHGSCPVKKGTKWGGTLWFHIPTNDYNGKK